MQKLCRPSIKVAVDKKVKTGFFQENPEKENIKQKGE